jgi:hypothetical protein
MNNFFGLFIAFITSYSVLASDENDIYGVYRETSLGVDYVMYEGDIVTIGESGYKHRRFTDELCSNDIKSCWLDDEPFKEYSNIYTLEDGIVTFHNSHLDEPTMHIVKHKERYYLFTKRQFQNYKLSGELPDYFLIQQR